MTDPSSPAVRVLRAQAMPADEIEAVLEAGDPAEIRRRLELHGECLRERLLDDLRTLERVERLLTADVRAVSDGRALSVAASR